MQHAEFTVLLVEDNPAEARLLRELLVDSQLTRFVVVSADKLTSALAHLNKADFDVILLDLSLPDQTGIETFRAVNRAAKKTPIVVLTGFDDERTAMLAMQEGAQDYLTKQYTDSRLIDRAIRYAIQRRRAEEDRLQLIHEQAARREAEKANALKMQFLAMVSHELRTPISSIKGFATTLLADDVEWDADSQREFLEIIDQEADKLTDLVEQLLDLARVQAGMLRIEASPQHLQNIVQLALPEVGVLSQEHEFSVSLGDALPTIYVDPIRVAQVISNLVSNAARYSPAGTRITLTAERVGDFVQIDVSDEGSGIPVELREVVFEAFRQIQRATSTKGAGLGLAICKGIVEAHGGKIWIADKAPPGTRFIFTVPVNPD